MKQHKASGRLSFSGGMNSCFTKYIPLLDVFHFIFLIGLGHRIIFLLNEPFKKFNVQGNCICSAYSLVYLYICCVVSNQVLTESFKPYKVKFLLSGFIESMVLTLYNHINFYHFLEATLLITFCQDLFLSGRHRPGYAVL